MIIILPFIALIIYIVLKSKFIKNKYLTTFLKYIFIASLISVSLELTIFNFRHYESLFYQNPQDYTNFTYGDGLKCHNNICTIINPETAYIELSNLDTKINDLKLTFDSPNALIVSYDLYFTDAANGEYLQAGTRTYVKNNTRSHYLPLNTSGNTTKLKLTFKDSNYPFNLTKITLNTKIPLIINNLRLLLVFLISFIIFVINPRSILHHFKYNNQHLKIVTAILIISFSLISNIFTMFNSKSYTTKNTSQYYQYQNLAEALSNHHFYLDLKVSSRLKDLPNPYDTSTRELNLRKKDYYWDYAYYKGKYYTYFGIVPCLLTYYPYYMLTNKPMSNFLAMDIGALLLIVSSFYFVYQLISKYFKNTSYIYYALLSIFLLFASGYTSFIGYPTIYSLPIVFGVSFALFGLSFWLKSTSAPKLNKKYLLFGSICMALTAGCRPQLLLTSLFAFIIFKDYYSDLKTIKKNIPNILIFLTPFIIIGLFLMYYNYARFDSIFNFGANYNLTTNDMTKRGFNFHRIFLGLYYFLFNPGKITTIFPFIMKENIYTTYIGKTIYENMYGGFFFINIICLLGLFFFKFKKLINNKNLYNICFMSLIITLIILILDTQIAGILPRYLSDFGFLITISTIIVILSLLKEGINLDFEKLIVALIMISIIYNSFTYFLNPHVFATYDFLKNLYYNFYYTFMFWV